MTREEKELVAELMTGAISKAQFLTRFPLRLEDGAALVLRVLEEASINKLGDDIEAALLVGFSFSLFNRSHVDVLCSLLTETWHRGHENMASALQKLKDPRGVESLYQAAVANFDYLDYDEAFALGVKCVWALGAIASEDAKEKLRLLADSKKATVREAALGRLERLS